MISMIIIYYATPKHLRKELIFTMKAFTLAITDALNKGSNKTGKMEP